MHIYAGTHKDNMRDVVLSNAYDPENYDNVKW